MWTESELYMCLCVRSSSRSSRNVLRLMMGVNARLAPLNTIRILKRELSRVHYSNPGEKPSFSILLFTSCQDTKKSIRGPERRPVPSVGPLICAFNLWISSWLLKLPWSPAAGASTLQDEIFHTAAIMSVAKWRNDVIKKCSGHTNTCFLYLDIKDMKPPKLHYCK